MGNSGLRKMLSPLDVVQTKYKSHKQINLMTLDKQLINIPSNLHKNVVFLHYRKNINEEILNQLRQLPETLVVLLPDSQCPDSFQHIRQRYPESYAKIQINGDRMHPLFKYLKRNCSTFYERYGMGARPITEVVGAFLVPNSDQNQQIKYYRENELTELVNGVSGETRKVSKTSSI